MNFATNKYSPYGRAGLTATPTVNWISDTTVTAKTVAGSGNEWYIDLSVGRLEGQLSQAFSYNQPVAVNVSVQNSPALGSCLSDDGFCVSTHSITVTGSTFGALDYTISVRIGCVPGTTDDFVFLVFI